MYAPTPESTGSSVDDRPAVERLRHGDRDALTELYRRHGGKLRQIGWGTIARLPAMAVTRAAAGAAPGLGRRLLAGKLKRWHCCVRAQIQTDFVGGHRLEGMTEHLAAPGQFLEGRALMRR